MTKYIKCLKDFDLLMLAQKLSKHNDLKNIVKNIHFRDRVILMDKDDKVIQIDIDNEGNFEFSLYDEHGRWVFLFLMEASSDYELRHLLVDELVEKIINVFG